MNYVGKFFSWGKDLYKDLNAATLTGAIDVIVVEQPDGSFRCSPFHVRFGKLGVLRSKEKEVDVFVNNEPVELNMKLGDSGVAYFVEEEEEEPEPTVGVDLQPSEERSSSPIGSSCILEEHQQSRGSRTPVTYNRRERDNSDSDSDVSYKSAAPGAGSAECVGGTGSRGGRSSRQGVLRRSFSCPTPSNAECQRSSRTHSLSDAEDDMHSILSQYSLDRRGLLPRPFSDGDLTPPKRDNRSPRVDLRDFSALSDTDLLSCGKHKPASSHQQLSWSWGRLPMMESIDGRHGDCAEPVSEQNTSESVATDERSAESRSGGQGSFFGSVMQRLWPKGQARQQQDDGDIYLSELNLDDMEPELAARYLEQRPSVPPQKQNDGMAEVGLDTSDSGAVSMPGSPPTTAGILSECPAAPVSSQHEPSVPPPSQVLHLLENIGVELSLCGSLKNPDGDKAPGTFPEKRVTFDMFCENPDLLSSPHLVVRVGQKYYSSWQVAAPVIIALLVFQKPLPEKSIHSLVKRHMPKKRRFGWFSWRGGEERQANDINSNEQSASKMACLSMKGGNRVGRRWRAVNGFSSDVDNDAWHSANAFSSDEDIASADELVAQSGEESVTVKRTPCQQKYIARNRRSSASNPDFDPWQQTLEESKADGRREKRMLRLSSDRLHRLRLRPGKNSISFSVTTKYQGTTVTTATVYLWHHSDKLVVSDIDGTITKSDVYGHILPWFGNDWAHTGVAELFSAIERNGYRFVYLSARAIGQAHITRQYLRSIKQGKLSLPEGPVLLNPSSLIHAFHREVILKKPEEFKIAALRDVAAVFGSIANPYHAGFGNRLTDVVTYVAVGIPRPRIFTINPSGRLTHDLSCTFQSTYNNLLSLTDQFFPPVNAVVSPTTPEAFNQFNFWRRPLLDIVDLDDLP